MPGTRNLSDLVTDFNATEEAFPVVHGEPTLMVKSGDDNHRGCDFKTLFQIVVGSK